MGRHKLASIRRRYCDCVLRVSTGNTTDTDVGGERAIVRDIAAHRAVLAQATYFARLFARAEPDSADSQPDGDVRYPFRLVYRVGIPFRADSVSFLVDLLYGTAESDAVADACVDTADVVAAAIYLGLDRKYLVAIIEGSLATLLVLPREGAQEAVAQLGRFVLCLVHGDVEPNLKAALLARTFGLLSEADRLSVPAGMVPTHYYRPEPAVADGAHDDGRGRLWRKISLPCDGSGDGRECDREITWEGIRFGASMIGSTYEPIDDDDTYESEIEISVSAKPDGEALGRWAHSALPEGYIDTMPRAATVVATVFHPTRGVTFRREWTKSISEKGDTRALNNQMYAYESTRGRLPKHMALVPTVPARSVPRGGARRVNHTVYADGVWSNLLACTVKVQVEELACP
ncbi:hypothetical protein [Pandoravirus japonicus]|uniref:BTB domain-containing protein n=1 Tax=Pandoravirus japonicus TaxID=2823154 RepID=A0A811BNG4_9VIRU|nr:hypothetical protein [Pandoravirus japonicus]